MNETKDLDFDVECAALDNQRYWSQNMEAYEYYRFDPEQVPKRVYKNK